MPRTTLAPRDQAEAIALFRAEIVGSLIHRELAHGDLRSAFREASGQRFCAPGAHGLRTYSAVTLERWYYAFKARGLDALRPKVRSDRGRGRELPSDLRKLLLAIRTELPHVSVPTILATLVADGRLAKGTVSLDAREKGPTPASQKGPTPELRGHDVGPSKRGRGRVGVVGAGPRLIA